jgi:hypothetical protein
MRECGTVGCLGTAQLPGFSRGPCDFASFGEGWTATGDHGSSLGRATSSVDSEYRHLWALLCGQTAHIVNKKAVYRVLKQTRWVVHQRSCTPRPRVRGWVSRASRSNERWAMDVTPIPCGQDGGPISSPSLIVTIANSWAMSLRYRVGLRKPNAQSKRPVCSASAHSDL